MKSKPSSTPHAISFPVGRDTDDFSTFLRYGINFIPNACSSTRKASSATTTPMAALELKVLRRKG